ncbi:hypothetical protein ColTof4_13251 [Colletotrichum tofieldiae]|uniref:Uncharacterized protein n=1 Tax=Colletotrichum tofieldiae TaxID=708197 RepID=A0A161YDK0_9PEZI|nr:hypothetical protein CT0861_07089 [Colletotrichum tofieldiae]GKT52771.1 hypothetical protein ColTof3_00110 [Colletotrichum tofieldiae]GKT80828.1 hypothetical protein ColTof4_13251 [Colletotrichum tofieldiae]GKT88960.1 hypothetical protein Ct61P_06810 [Colletotrichum tofieldiae]
MAHDAAQEQAAPELPPLVKLIETRWRWRGQLYDASEIPKDFVFGAEALDPVVIPNDRGNFVILSLLRRGHRRYRLDNELSEDSYYAGIEGGLFTPVFIRGAGRTPAPDMSNSYHGVLVGIGSTRQPARLIIPPVEMLRPRQLAFLKVQSLGAEHHPGGEPAFRQVSKGEKESYQRNQQDAFLNGRGCEVFIEDPTAELDYNVLDHMKKENWELFRMNLPKLADIKIPKGLVDEIKSFLAKYPQDIVPINLAVSMAIVWWAYLNTAEYQPELIVSKRRYPLRIGQAMGEITRPVPDVDLAELILYAPHYFRIHEEHGLSAYCHIFRIVSFMCSKDEAYDAAFEIDPEDINHELVSRYVSQMNLKDKDWEEIVPPSFDGSRIPMPKNHGTRAPPSPELTASLMMPDIYSIGFAGYTNVSTKAHGSKTRNVMMHGSWVPKHVLDDTNWAHLDRDYLGTESLLPYHGQESHQLWTAPMTKVRSPWPEIATVDTPPPLPAEETRSSAVAAAEKLQMSFATSDRGVPDAQNLRSREFGVRDYFRLHVADLRTAHDAGLISKLVTIGLDGHLTWPNQPKRLEEPPKLPCEINIKDLVAEDAASANRVPKKDRLILRMILEEDLANDKHVAQCLQPLRRIDVNNANLTTGFVKYTLSGTVGPIEKAMRRVLDYGNSIGDSKEDTFMNELVKPCCELLGLDVDGSSSECKDAIHRVERELHAAIINVEFVVRYQRENVESFKIAMNLITSAPCFRYISRLMLFNKRICRVELDEDDKKAWVGMFGASFKDDGGDD